MMKNNLPNFAITDALELMIQVVKVSVFIFDELPWTVYLSGSYKSYNSFFGKAFTQEITIRIKLTMLASHLRQSQ